MSHSVYVYFCMSICQSHKYGLPDVIYSLFHATINHHISSPDLQKCPSAFSVISRKSQLKFKHFVPSNGSY